MPRDGVSRRELLAAGAAAGVALGAAPPAYGRAEWSYALDFRKLAAGRGWPGWHCVGVANVRRHGGRGLLEAASDVFPYDPRPVAFAVDRRFRDGEIVASVESGGAGTGVVLRRVGPRSYYAAIYDDEARALVVVRRSPAGLEELGRAPAGEVSGAFQLSLRARGCHPTALVAELEPAGGAAVTVSAHDATAALQRPGDPGVLATARTLFPSSGGPGPPALGNVHLLPYGVQEGEAVMQTAVGKAVLARIRERSTAVLKEIRLRAVDRRRTTRPSVVAATTGAPIAHGAKLRVASDVPAHAVIEVSHDPAFRHSRRIDAGRTNSFGAVLPELSHLRPGRHVYWRVRLRRHGRESVGPVRRLRVLPQSGSPQPATVAIAACASQFGPIFDQLAARRPDAFVWQGDLNYPDTVGPLAQTVAAYGGIWRDFLANPRMRPLLQHTMFAVQRDDHDYGVQDANSTNLVRPGIAPWEALMEHRIHYRFSAGLADFWVLDERRFKSDPDLPDTRHKTLLGSAQRTWLLRTLAASRAPFKVVCSPCTLAPLPANKRDGSWAVGFTAERDLILDHVRHHVSGRTIFVTGDTHWTMVYERGGLFEARPCPLGIPTPNDVTLTDPQAAENARGKPGVKYADDEHGHFALVRVSGHGGRARLDLTLVRDDGAAVYRRRFERAL